MDSKFACSGILAALVGFFTIGISIYIHSDWFSWSHNALSDLGAVGTVHAAVFNWGMIITGILGLTFGVKLIEHFSSPAFRIGPGYT